MKHGLLLLLILLNLTAPVRAASVPEELEVAAPKPARDLWEELGQDNPLTALTGGLKSLLYQGKQQAKALVSERLRGALGLLAVVMLCSLAESVGRGNAGKTAPYLLLTGTLAITYLTAGSLDSLIAMGVDTIEELHTFSQALLPTLTAATVAAGAISGATVRQVATVFAVDLLISLMDRLLMPMVSLYVGTLAAACCLPESRLMSLAQGLKKTVTWLLTTVLMLFVTYLSVAGIFSATVDGATVRVAKTAIAGVVPVVGSIISEAAETVLAGAGMLRSTIGVFGLLGILAVCAVPFLQLGMQYLAYKCAAFLAGAIGHPAFCQLIDGLGGAFGLVLGMTGSCALMLLVSVLSSVAVVIP